MANMSPSVVKSLWLENFHYFKLRRTLGTFYFVQTIVKLDKKCWLEVIMNGWIENVLMQFPRTKMTNFCTCRVVEHQLWIGPKILSSVDA